MAVKIRLKRMGKIRAPFYRIVVADARTKRDGRVIEEIGKYNPKLEPSLIEVDSERAQHWLSVGAQPSEPVLALLRKTGDWQKYKGEPAPDPLREQATKAVKLDVFNEALKEVHADTAPDAVSAKKPRKKAAAVPADKQEPAAEASAADEPAADAPAAKKAPAADARAAKKAPAAKKTPVAKKPPAAKAVPAADAPAVEAPAVEAPAAEEPAAQQPAPTPADETPDVAAEAAEKDADSAADAAKQKTED